jgi:hypothetical protein
MVASQFLPVLVLPLLGWRFYARYRKLVGVQRPSAGRQWASVILFPLLLAMVLWSATLVGPLETVLLSALGGAAIGLGLAHWGLKLTRFGHDETGPYYEPNRYIGLALMVMFLGRLAYRFLQASLAGGNMQAMAGNPQSISQPATLLVMAIIFAYYPYYSAGILRWSKAQGKLPAADKAPAANLEQ